MKLKRSIKFFWMVEIAASILCIPFTGCTSYLPEEGSRYFELGDNYRIIELDDSMTEEHKNYLLESLTPKHYTASFSEVVLHPEYIYQKNSLFYEDGVEVTADGVETIYAYIGIEKHPSLENITYDIEYPALRTFNIRIDTEESYIFTDANGFEYETYYLGLCADVKIYTFNYTDYAKNNGTVTDSGIFRVIITMNDSVVNMVSGA